MLFWVSEKPHLHCYFVFPQQKEFETTLMLTGKSSNSLNRYGRQNNGSPRMSMFFYLEPVNMLPYMAKGLFR